MFYYIALFTMFYIIKNKKNNLKFLKFFYLYNSILFILFNYNDIVKYDYIFVYICYFLIIYFANYYTFFIFICVFYMKVDNLIANLLLLEILNFIFFAVSKKNFLKLKNIIIYNFFISTIYIIFSLSYF